MNPAKENLILKLSFEFSLGIIAFSEKLREHKKYEMASQIFRSGTSIGANVHEAQNAESRADFIHKCKIAAKEADEVLYWLLLCEKSEYYSRPSQLLFDQLKSITLILSKIISSSKKKSAN
ncbi:four helix bundle protein [Zunongwangia sp. F363]|uniref:Four helix bundle protein n=1 Tax=Autumnicola tepida TaxID=3075595 RepID=A0ABU3C701_9FLAO|nr:four helix bundle protein [Zunongwangia sp. F363]MDT0642120.1 four helix bundle protein [Zunongwangia sp. F363]